MKGQRKLFMDVFPEEEKKQGTDAKGKNRRPELREARDRALVYRYFYWSAIHKLRFDVCVKQLETEFFISEDTIIDRMQRYASDIVDRVRVERPTIEQLREMFPHFLFEEK